MILKGCLEDDVDRIRSAADLKSTIHGNGFLPVYANEIPMFSLEESTIAEDWGTGNSYDPLVWIRETISDPDIAFGCFFHRNADAGLGFVSKEWFPILANYRRDGYDFDAAFEDGIADHLSWKVMEQFAIDEKMVGEAVNIKDILEKVTVKKPAEAKNTLLLLQFQTYLILCGGKISKTGVLQDQVFCTPETKWGYETITQAYSMEPSEAREKIMRKIKFRFPGATEYAICSVFDPPVPDTSKKNERKKPVSVKKKDVNNKAEMAPYPENLIRQIGLEIYSPTGRYTPLSADQLKGLEYAISTLTENRLQELIKLRFEERLTQSEIARRIGRSTSRAGQLIALAVRQLRHPYRAQYYVEGYSAVENRKQLIIPRYIHKTGADMTDAEIKEALGDLASVRILDLNLSVRAFNCLKRGGLYTVYDLVLFLHKEPGSLLAIRNIGVFSAKEIYDKLSDLGLGDWASVPNSTIRREH